MKKRIITVVLAVMLVFCFSISAFAYSPQATANISEVSNSLVFTGSLRLDAPKNEINHSYYNATVTQISSNRVLFTDDRSDYPPSSPYNSKYTLQSPDSDEYEITVAGTVVYYAQSSDYPYAAKSLFYGFNSSGIKSQSNKTATAFIKDQTNQLVNAFDIDLSQYKQVERGSDEFLKSNLLTLNNQISLAYGDTVPAYFINDDKNEGIILKQDINGIDYLYSFTIDSENVEVNSTKQVQKEFIGDRTFFERNPVSPIEAE